MSLEKCDGLCYGKCTCRTNKEVVRDLRAIDRQIREIAPEGMRLSVEQMRTFEKLVDKKEGHVICAVCDGSGCDNCKGQGWHVRRPTDAL